ncbi:CRISPR-associated endonuclease Cas3'' [Azospirillum thermophilum]|uniref:CRISPR-associated endonuclease Cas3 n=2 Tax=Azospirillum thermophilum TaxID=2202148 RepID=A0A2S2CMQ6_9PROT|nr:CRISPR-associated endonuclease Cas3'' [Azospirillum thermophilum]
MGNPLQPYEYQRRLAVEPWPEVLIAPTGLGKTAAIVLGWLWRRRIAREDTPLRLVLCLPMRTLVEQTRDAVRGWLDRLGASEDVSLPHPEDGVVVLMGGGEREKEPPPWMRHPERPAILIGTQDMLLSRALMRGYGMSRFRWPVDFALLHNDAQWVFDEVQAMGAGLATSAQLQGLREALGTARPARSLWLSATLDPAWLVTVDHRDTSRILRVPDDVPQDAADPRVRRLLVEAHKHVRPATSRPGGAGGKDIDAYAAALAGEVLEAHRPGRTTIVILNTVARAQKVHRALTKRMGPEGADRLLLIHSRFRPAERKAQLERLTGPEATADRIVVATQAIEAGVDVTSALLFTELAPWPSLVQRFGRVNRYGECGDGAEIRWIDLPVSKEVDPKGELAVPYAAEGLAEAHTRLADLVDAAPANLPPPERTPGDRTPPVRHVLRRKDLLDLFDTDPDLTGFDIDVSPFIRDTKDTDFQVLWRDFATGKPDDQPLPRPEELCSVPIRRGEELLKARQGWRLNPQAKGTESIWVRLDGKPWPGLVVMLDAALGGYDPVIGLAPEITDRKVPIHEPPSAPQAGAPDPDTESHDDDRDTRQDRPVPLTDHLVHVAETAEALCAALEQTHPLSPADRAAVVTAARWHDVGKAHPKFQERMTEPVRPDGALLAKASRYDRRKGRPYFRHELASALAFLQQHGGADANVNGADLVAYLIAAHHGKVRLSLRALPQESAPAGVLRFARGIHEGDGLPAVDLGDGGRSDPVSLSLGLMELGDSETQGLSWAARTARLLEDHKPFRLAWLESLVRIADWRASADEQDKARQRKTREDDHGQE